MGFAVLCCTKRAGEARAPEALTAPSRPSSGTSEKARMPHSSKLKGRQASRTRQAASARAERSRLRRRTTDAGQRTMPASTLSKPSMENARAIGAFINGKRWPPPWKWSCPRSGTADDGQIGVGTDEPPRVGVREIEQPRDGAVIDGHGAVLARRYDEVLREVAVGREPPGPGLAAEGDLGHGRARAPQVRRAVLPRRLPAQVAGRRDRGSPFPRVALHRCRRSLAFPSGRRLKRRATEGCPRCSGDVPRIFLRFD